MKNAFTILEVLIAVGIIILITALVVPVYGGLQISAQLNENSTQIAQAVKIARERASSGYHNTQHGVEFQADRYTLYQGASYIARDTDYDREIILGSTLSISTTLTNDEVNFSARHGVPDNTGTITLSHDNGGTKTITVNSMGKVEED